ncbi:MAG: PhoPQ-activated protein PqaA family protein [Chloroherpetonaceae bacterium]|nr:PhoPQ-activated pathogenicity-related family protein [Chthonomonadaceae bacterium]MDW8208618.1 PhoPQ-activated protein PqaA family protein [Chloroherpetonaceae bacterium]
MRIRTAILPLIALSSILLLQAPGAQADFYQYLNKPEPAYRWEVRGTTTHNGVTIHELHLVSQTWQGHVWEHRLQLFRPTNLTHPHFCTLLNTGGNGSEEEAQVGAMMARQYGGHVAFLYGVPKQPLYGGKTEDALIVYTWQKFLETGDPSWPLHFPMAKSVIKAMDAIQEYARTQQWQPIREFLITGASKRGWTTWLVGASKDRRVRAIAPMVIDTLNIPAQIPHQLASFGKPSEQIADYTESGMLEMLNTEKGRRLLELEDPYSYRNVLTLPKLIINGTNDRYWAQDALNLYWDGLKGPKWILYVPNTGHDLQNGDITRVLNTMAGFAHAIASKTPLPRMRWEYRPDPDGTTRLHLHSDIPPVSARLFHTTAPTKDFRDSRWTSTEIPVNGSACTAPLPRPQQGYLAAFGEATYRIGGKTFTLSTQIRIESAR